MAGGCGCPLPPCKRPAAIRSRSAETSFVFPLLLGETGRGCIKLLTAHDNMEIHRRGQHGHRCPRFGCCWLRLYEDLSGQARVFLYERDIMCKRVTLFYVTRTSTKEPALLPRLSSNLFLQPDQMQRYEQAHTGSCSPTANSPGAAGAGWTRQGDALKTSVTPLFGWMLLGLSLSTSSKALGGAGAGQPQLPCPMSRLENTGCQTPKRCYRPYTSLGWMAQNCVVPDQSTDCSQNVLCK